jgi:hypothetical protein
MSYQMDNLPGCEGSARKASAAIIAVHKGPGHSGATMIVLSTLSQLVLDVDGRLHQLWGATDMDGHNWDTTPLGAERLH